MKKIILLALAVLMVFAFAACGESIEDPENAKNITSEQQEISTSSTQGDNDDDYIFDIKEDDHTVIITIANTKQVYTHDGVNVTGYTTYVDSGDAKTAKVVANSINLEDEYYANLGIKSVKSKGKYLIQEYSEEGFPCKTYEELHDLAEQYKQIQQ